MSQAVLGIPGLTFGGAGIWTLVALAVVWLIRIQPKMRELANNADGSLRKDLMDRIDKLEKQLLDERRECDRELEKMRVEMRGMQQTMDGLHRQLITQSSALALRLPPGTAASAAADRLVERFTQENEEGQA